jgi:DNA/RNA-binding domain of Phe-tRNA-synthetase-like protein
MKFKIDSRIFEQFPELSVGLVVAKGINNKGSNEEIMKLLKTEQEKIRADFSIETLSENPKIDVWKKAYSLFEAKPKKYRCSVESLYRLVLRGIDLKHFNKLVDIYNYISIKHTVPIGGDDLDKIDGNITLKFARGDEPFNEIGSEEVKHPKEGEIVYADDKEVICRRWNWRDCDKTKMTESTKNMVLIVEGLPPVSKDKIEEITKELRELIQKFCGGESNIFILNSAKAETEI